MQKLRIRLGWRHLAFMGCLLSFAAFGTPADHATYGPWSAPVNLGAVVNSVSYDACPTISKDGLSLYFRSNRPGGQGGFDIWVAKRDSVEEPWGEPVNLGDVINGPYNEYCSSLSVDGHWMIFVSDRPGCGSQDLWVTHRRDKRDDVGPDGWETPINLGCVVNSASQENGPALFEDEATGQTFLYFSSGRAGGLGGLDIYVSVAASDDKSNFGPPALVTELSSAYTDYQPTISRDGLEIFFASNRPGGSGAADLWTSTRSSLLDAWSQPVNLGPTVNSAAADFRPALSFDGRTLFFASERASGSVGSADLWACIRSKLNDPN